MKKAALWGHLIVLLVLLVIASPSLAESDNFICAVAEAAACNQDEPCVRGSASLVSLPLIWKVDLEKKSIMSLREDGEQRFSEILEMIENEESLMLFGVDGIATWSVVIDKNVGKMTLSSSTPETGFVVHGACSTKILK